MKGLYLKKILVTTLIAVLALTSSLAYSYDEVYTIVNNHKYSASKLYGTPTWALITQPEWPDTFTLVIRRTYSTTDVICDSAAVTSDSPPFQLQTSIQRIVPSNDVTYSYKAVNVFTTAGIPTNRSQDPVLYQLQAVCHNTKENTEFQTHFRIKVIGGWDPDSLGDDRGLIIVSPQEGTTITGVRGTLEVKLEATGEKPAAVIVKIQKAGVVDDTGVIGDISLPAGKKVYGSQWETVLGKTNNPTGEGYDWPENSSTMYIRQGLAGPGLYRVFVTGVLPEGWGAMIFGPIERTFFLGGIQEQQASTMKAKPSGSTKSLPPADAFGTKKRASITAVAPTPKSETYYTEPLTDTKPVLQPIKEISRPMSGPVPKLQPPSLARAPAVVAPVPMTRQRVDTTSQKAPVTAEQPGLKRQVALARPEITYPTPNAVFTAPASVSAKARLVSGKRYFYGLRQQGQTRDIGRNGNGRFTNLNAGDYCVYVAYDPGGPASDCVPFSVRIAMQRAPAMQTAPKPITQPAPTISPKPVSPQPIKRTAPGPSMPGE